ncbi:MAG: aliphatic sulfonate ABC transporter substrate-binding protein [Labrys sp. (in: a-proteobacteria)]|jgi:sulfonate transport system substrate-binding protein
MAVNRRTFLTTLAAGGAVLAAPRLARAAGPTELRVDWATYNPLSILIRNNKWLEAEFEKDGIAVTWVQSAGSNKALEFLNAGSIDFGSTAGAAALIARSNGNPTKLVGVFSRPEWTALVTGKDGAIRAAADLKGRTVAVTRGTDPHIFLIRSLAEAGLAESDIRVVPLQHADGRLALQRGDVEAWAGLDPMMAAAELDDGAVLFQRNPAFNSWGVINVREAFAAENPEIVRRYLGVYEKARQHALANPGDVKAGLVAAAKLPEPVIERQLTRTDFSNKGIGDAQADTIREAGLALQKAGVLKPEVDVEATLGALIDRSFSSAG